MANKYAHLKAKARELRQRGYTLSEIVDFLKLPKTTVYGWIKDVEIDVKRLRAKHLETYSDAKRERDKQNALRFAKKREEAYEEGKRQAPELAQDIEFVQFIILYLAEGHKKARNSVSISNSDVDVMIVSHDWLRKFANPDRSMEYTIQIHADHDEMMIKRYWAKHLGIQPEQIKTTRKSNSGGLAGRQFRSVYGVLSIRVGDTYLRAKLQAWMDYFRAAWRSRRAN